MLKQQLNTNQQSETHNNISLNPKGRKPLNLEERCTIPVSFRLSKLQHEKLENYCKTRGGKAAVIKSLLADKNII